MPTKRIIVIHGRATKPSGSKKEELVLKSLLHGLGRVNPAAANKVKNGKVKFDFIYYGDISNREMVKASKKARRDLKGTNDAQYEFSPCELPESYDDDLERLFARELFTEKAYAQFLREERDMRVLDEVAAVASGIARIFGLNDELVAKTTPDMGAYLLTRKVGSEVRQRLQASLKAALLAGDDICLIGHSMGTIVCYDVLWKFSQMSEYRDVQEVGTRVSLWLTLGCPLGEPGVVNNLYDSNERSDGKYPRGIIQDWVNIAAQDDFVAHDKKLADDFKPMTKYMGRLTDQRIYNFWAGSSGSNPHKFYGYLDHPDVAKRVADWIG